MKRKPNEKEKKYLRELVGENGTQAHYFNPDYNAAQQYRERKKAAQLAEMREAAGGVKAPARREKNAAAQLAEMRKAAGNFKGPKG